MQHQKIKLIGQVPGEFLSAVLDIIDSKYIVLRANNVPQLKSSTDK